MKLQHGRAGESPLDGNRPNSRVSDGFIPPHGGYRDLRSYQMSEIVYDATVKFCERFLQKRDRTYDQMIQAARSGKQNIVEGSQVSGTSKEMEIKLMNVARASLEELLVDYQDFLRTHGAKQWAKDDKEAAFVRRLGSKENRSYTTYKTYIETRPAAVVANIVICVIHQTNYLLDRQIRVLEKEFVEKGGLREAMTRSRLSKRTKQTREERE